MCRTVFCLVFTSALMVLSGCPASDDEPNKSDNGTTSNEESPGNGESSKEAAPSTFTRQSFLKTSDEAIAHEDLDDIHTYRLTSEPFKSPTGDSDEKWIGFPPLNALKAEWRVPKDGTPTLSVAELSAVGIAKTTSSCTVEFDERGRIVGIKLVEVGDLGQLSQEHPTVVNIKFHKNGLPKDLDIENSDGQLTSVRVDKTGSATIRFNKE